MAPAKKAAAAAKAPAPAKKAPATSTKAAPKDAPAKAASKVAAKPSEKGLSPAPPADKPLTKGAKAPAAKKAAPAKAAAPAKDSAPAKDASPGKDASPAKEVASKAAPAKKASSNGPAKAAAKAAPEAEAPRSTATGPASDGVSPTGVMWEHFDAKFLEGQRKLLLEERAEYTGSAESLQAEAQRLTEEYEPGDVQFDDESGEGDSIVVERDRDLALSAQAKQTVAEIDAALGRLLDGTYGISEVSGLPIPKERLKAIPWTTVRVEEKVGGIGHRR